MSCKPHEPTDKSRAEVSALASYGVPQEDIAGYLEIDAKTLRKYYRKELDDSALKANANVSKFLYSAASGKALTAAKGATHADCIRAAMFWAKTRMGWRETVQLDHQNDGGPFKPMNLSDFYALSEFYAEAKTDTESGS